MVHWSFRIAWAHYHGPLFNHPWYKDLLAENSPPYEDSSPSNKQVVIDQSKPHRCPKCGALLIKDGQDNACFICGFRDSFANDRAILEGISLFWENAKRFGNQDVLKSRRENILAENNRQACRRWAAKNDRKDYRRRYRESHRQEENQKSLARYYANHSENKKRMRETAKLKRQNARRVTTPSLAV